MELNPILHVVAAIFVSDSKVLACRRAAHKSAAGKWEFPGGKVEIGESSNEALVREIAEELGVRIRVLEHFDISETHIDGQLIRLETALCHLEGAELKSSTDHDSYIWVGAVEALKLDWAKPDLPALSNLIQQGLII